MIRSAALAFAAAAICAAPAAFAETASQVRLDGRTESQIRADVQAVAARLCAEKMGTDAPDAIDACVSNAVRITMKKVAARGNFAFTAANAD